MSTLLVSLDIAGLLCVTSIDRHLTICVKSAFALTHIHRRHRRHYMHRNVTQLNASLQKLM